MFIVDVLMLPCPEVLRKPQEIIRGKPTYRKSTVGREDVFLKRLDLSGFGLSSRNLQSIVCVSDSTA